MTSIDAHSPAAAATGGEHLDLGPLAWVMDEVRLTLEAATETVERYAQDNEQSRTTDLAEVDTGPMRLLRQQVHQAAGALDMVNLNGGARVLEALEALVQRWVQRPAQANVAAAQAVRQGARALLDYLDRCLRERPLPALALFPTYRDWQQLAGAERVHPADLWEQTVLRPAQAPAGPAWQPGPQVRAHFDRLVLLVVKSLHPQAAAPLAQLCGGLCRGSSDAPEGPVAQFWLTAAAYFEAVAHSLLPDDVYVKRAASRVLLQYSGLAQGHLQGLEQLTRDLGFFAAQAVPGDPAATPHLTAVRSAQGWAHTSVFDYHAVRLGLYDLGALALLRARIESAQQSWSLWSEGDVGARASALQRLNEVADAWQALYPAGSALSTAWRQVVQGLADANPTARPDDTWALEVANSLLFLEAVAQDFDPLDAQWPDRLQALARRLNGALQGKPAPPPEPWMTDVFRRVNQRQTLGHLVSQLQAELGEVERVLDGYLRGPQPGALDGVAQRLDSMRGISEVLELPAVGLALQAIAAGIAPWQGATGLPTAHDLALGAQRVAPNLSALGWLFEALRRQPEWVREQFVFDAASGCLRGPDAVPDLQAPIPLPGAAVPGAAQEVLESAPVSPPEEAIVAAEPAAPLTSAAPVVVEQEAEDDEAELLTIFSGEAVEVLSAADSAVAALRAKPDSLEDLTALRRSFHTLKGSARMVGLTDLGESAWAMEQLLNSWLAEQRPASDRLLDLCQQVLPRLRSWVDAMVQGLSYESQAAAVRASADALRLEGRWLDLEGQAFTSSPAMAEASEPALTLLAEPEPEPELEPMDDAVKVIGPLRVDLELYNVYLNEADEWSRRLCTDLGEWAMQPEQPMPPDASALAHSLAGASATVGYTGLSALARAIEHALDRAQPWSAAGAVLANDVAVLLKAAEEARHLLHQFAAGFWREPQPETLTAVAAAWLGELPQPPVQPPAEPFTPTEDNPQPLAVPEPSPLERSTEAPASAAANAPDIVEVAPADEVVDHLDIDLFPVLEDEVSELLPRLGAALRQWVARPDNQGARAEVLRNLHTFKGSARLAGALRLGDMVHRMESQVLSLPDAPDSMALRPVQAALDAIQARFDTLRAAHVQRRDALSAASVAEGVLTETPEALPVEADTAQPTLPSALPVAVASPYANVRVRPELLDRLMAQTGDVMTTRNRLEAEVRQLRQSFQDMSTNLERLRYQLRDLELQTETQVQSRLAQSRDTESAFDPLEFDRYTRVQELTRLMAESVNDVATVQRQLLRAVAGAEAGLAAQARQARDLQRDLLRTRLVDFDTLAERLHRVVRQTAEALDKPAELHIEGGSLEVDRGVLDRVLPVLEHVLRNAVVHGIEPTMVRCEKQKPEVGQIHIRLQQSGNDLVLLLTDDGAGLDLQRIRERAVARGSIAVDAAFGPEEAARAIFEPGLSTADEVNELAGRGIGLDVARNDILSLGGRIECFAPTEGGTGFRLVVPLTTAVTQVVLVRVGDFVFGVPAPWVQVVRRASAPDLTVAYVSSQWREGGQLMPFYWAGALLSLSAESQDPGVDRARSWPVLVFHSAGQHVAWHVDEVLGHQEVVVKPLGPQLGRMPGLAGATVLASGAVALIYNPVAVAALYGDASRRWVREQREAQRSGAAAAHPQPVAAAAAQAPLVLVVDDSITVRRVTQRLLKREGYRVALAADGLQALERLREEAPVVVLCDIEMPRMDGFELVRHLRADARWADLPVVMVTSRLADKHRAYAQSLGVDHYLGKPYPEDELLALVSGYARLAAPLH